MRFRVGVSKDSPFLSLMSLLLVSPTGKLTKLVAPVILSLSLFLSLLSSLDRTEKSANEIRSERSDRRRYLSIAKASRKNLNNKKHKTRTVVELIPPSSISKSKRRVFERSELLLRPAFSLFSRFCVRQTSSFFTDWVCHRLRVENQSAQERTFCCLSSLLLLQKSASRIKVAPFEMCRSEHSPEWLR